MTWGQDRRGRPRRKMGAEGSANQWGGRKQVTDRMSVGGVQYTHTGLAGWTCTMCKELVALAGMISHARSHTADLARRAALTRISGVLELLDAEQLVQVLAVLPAVIANPVGFTSVARALGIGERKHPGRGLGPSPDQTVDDHVAALGRHAERSPDLGVGLAIGGLAVDLDTGLPHASLAAARGVLAVQLAEVQRG